MSTTRDFAVIFGALTVQTVIYSQTLNRPLFTKFLGNIVLIQASLLSIFFIVECIRRIIFGSRTTTTTTSTTIQQRVEQDGWITKVKVLISCDNEHFPTYETEDSAGCDLRAFIPNRGSKILEPGQVSLIDLGVAMTIPKGTVGFICSRSGLALKHKVHLINQPGILDSDYAENLGALLYNEGSTPFQVNHNDRIAQLVITPSLRADFSWVEAIGRTSSRKGGFGSTGVN